MNITILGAGAFGTSLGNILEQNNHVVTYYDNKIKLPLDEATKDADAVVLAIPSQFFAEPLARLRTDKPLIVATKGLLSLEPFEKFKKYAFLSGGAFADDLNNKLKTTLTATDKLVRKLFETKWLHFELTKDKLGVILCGSLKNIYAIRAGYYDVETNPKKRARMIAETETEMKQILKANGADPKTVDLSCGIGDLKVTFTSSSRNYRYGQNLKKDPNYQPTETTEGLTAIKSLKKSGIIIPEDAKIIRNIINNDWS